MSRHRTFSGMLVDMRLTMVGNLEPDFSDIYFSSASSVTLCLQAANFVCLLMIFANNLYPDQFQKNVKLDLGENCFTCFWCC